MCKTVAENAGIDCPCFSAKITVSFGVNTGASVFENSAEILDTHVTEGRETIQIFVKKKINFFLLIIYI